MFNTLKRIATALELQNSLWKSDQESSNNGAFLQKILNEQKEQTSMIADKLWVMQEYHANLISTFWWENWTMIRIPMLEEKCYFSWKLCIDTDKEKVSLIVIDEKWNTTHTQALKPYLPKQATEHWSNFVFFDKS